MAYGLQYQIPWLNREQDNCEVNISAKDYVGDVTTLEGSARPFTFSSQAQDNTIPYGICSTETVIELYTGGVVSLTDFYNEDDTYWLVQFYYRGSLAWTGYLQLDNSSEKITDQNHTLSLNANDGTSRLQTLYFIDDITGLPLIRNWTLAEQLSYIFAFIPILEIKAWLNIFENSTQDRGYLNYETFLPQTAFSTKYYINSDGTAMSLYEVLNNILLSFRCCMRQTDGYWQIIRWGDVRIFSDGTMPGTLYTGFTGSYSEIFFPESIDVGRGLERYPINENQISRILRPYQFAKETFNYNQADNITQNNLQIDTGATPFATTTIDGFRYDDYSIAAYFPTWTEEGGSYCYLEVITDTNIIPEAETDRYIVSPSGHAISGIEFNYIPVSAGDIIDFSFRFRTDTDISGDLRVYCKISVITPTTSYGVIAAVGTLENPHWAGAPTQANYIAPDTSGDTTQWMSYDISMSTNLTGQLITIPADGFLIIEIYGTNGDPAHDDYGIYWKDMSLTIYNFINTSIQITGQTHTNSQTPDIRNNEQFEINLDDSPRNSIQGTLFTNEITTFPWGDEYFTKTASWHRQGVSEARRLGDLNTYNDLFIQRKTRTIVEGDFYGLHELNLMSIINIPFLPFKKFIFGTASFDYMNCIWNATLYELFEEGEDDADLDNTYLFNYIYDNG